MGLNKSTGNMYPFITHTWNTVKGRCPHDCTYCYMKKWGNQPDLHFDERELKTDLGSDNYIFVGSSCDMWAFGVDDEWIRNTLAHCAKYFTNQYLFQSKAPYRYDAFDVEFPLISILATTIETNRYYKQMGNAQHTSDRGKYLGFLRDRGYPTVVTVEPIMDFDLPEMVTIIKSAYPSGVNIGANTNYKVKLPEPSPGKIRALISALSEFTEVKIKKNLNRLLEV